MSFPTITGLYLKAGIAIALLIAGFAGGCSVQAKRDKVKLEAADKALNIERQQTAILAATLAGIDEDTARQVEAAKAQQSAAASAGKAAIKAEVVYRDRLVYVDREIAAAMKSPTCKAQLEQPLCAALR